MLLCTSIVFFSTSVFCFLCVLFVVCGGWGWGGGGGGGGEWAAIGCVNNSAETKLKSHAEMVLLYLNSMVL